MNARTARLRQQSLDAIPCLSPERAVLMTDFYQAKAGLYSIPVMRAKSFLHLCQHKTIYLGDGELIVGERGPAPKLVPTFPELTCHSVEDLEILNSRPKTWYRVDPECIRTYREKIIPYWRGRSMRDRLFAELPPEWKDAYDAGIFTEFMEQRAPGHTVLDDKIYRKGLLDFKRDIAELSAKLDFLNDPQGLRKREALKSFDISCDALILFAERHAARAHALAARESDVMRKSEWLKIAEVCSHVPSNAPRNFYEALQYYWFCHLAVITELNGWDSFNPGHLDQHLLPFYEAGLADGSLTKEGVLDADFRENETLRQRLLHKTHKYGNDNDYADEITVRIFDTCIEELDGRPDTKGGTYRVEMLPTTCHVYFGSVTGATPDGRHARRALSEGISPVQGADRQGPTSVIKSASKIDHLKAGGTLLNIKFAPELVSTEEGLEKWAHLVRSYFKMDGHHVQFNVVRADTLRRAQANPGEHRDLIVRVAGYSDYFCDLAKELQEEIIERTEHHGFSS